jgi:hypothetical protein
MRTLFILIALAGVTAIIWFRENNVELNFGIALGAILSVACILGQISRMPMKHIRIGLN